MSGAQQRRVRHTNTILLADSRAQRHRFSAIEMTTAASPQLRRGPFYLGVDVGTGSARAGTFVFLNSFEFCPGEIICWSCSVS